MMGEAGGEGEGESEGEGGGEDKGGDEGGGEGELRLRCGRVDTRGVDASFVGESRTWRTPARAVNSGGCIEWEWVAGLEVRVRGMA